MRLAGSDIICDVYLLPFAMNYRVGNHACLHITTVDKSLTQLEFRHIGKLRIIYDRRLTETAHPSVKPFRSVGA